MRRTPMTLALAFAGALSFAAVAGAQTDQAGAGQAGTSGQTAGGQSGTGVGSGTQTGDTGRMGSSSGIRMDKANDDQKFLGDVAAGNLAEIQLSQLAVQNAQDPQVKQFAQTMVDEHTKAKDQLQQVASAAGVSLPTELDSKHQKLQSKLSSLSGADFDKEYMKLMVSSHKDMEGLLKKRAGKGNASAASGYGTSGGSSSTSATGTSGSTSATSGTSGTTGSTTSGTVASSSAGADVNGLASQLLPEVQQHLQQAKDIEKQLHESGKSSKDNSHK